jgi:hypothetical protein
MRRMKTYKVNNENGENIDGGTLFETSKGFVYTDEVDGWKAVSKEEVENWSNQGYLEEAEVKGWTEEEVLNKINE